MSEKLATIQRIHSITSHPNPEVTRIECAKIKGWPVVVKKGEYKEGDLVVFIVIDSIVPESNPYFSFMSKQKFRIWNAKFKGAPSSGLVCPLSILPIPKGCLVWPIVEDLDVTEQLGVTKFERPIDVSMNGKAKGNFPLHLISKSDEINLLSYPEALKELEGKEFYVTVKCDGSSTTFTLNQGEFKACSRNLEMQDGEGFPWHAVTKYDIKSKMLLYAHNIAIQAETIGPKMNGNRLGLKELDIRVFRAKNLDDTTLYSLRELEKLCKLLELPMVNLIGEWVYRSDVHTLDWFRNLANEQKYPNGLQGEGIVVQPTIPFMSEVLNKWWSVKIINQNYHQE